MVKKKHPNVLAIITARALSRSIPLKNIKLFGGHPLLAYSITAGLQAKTVNRVIVSTDDPEIAEIARSYGAEAPFRRPAELALDDTLDFPVIKHALEWLEHNVNYTPEIIAQLRPTTPIRPHTCVDDAVELLLSDPEADSVRGIVPSSQNPYKMWRINKKYLFPLIETEFNEPYNMPRQKLPKTYWQTGHIDAIRYRTIIDKKSLTGNKILPLMLDPVFAVDIDTELDWERAEWHLSKLGNKVVRPHLVKAKLFMLANIRLIVLDFDGVFTNNHVFVLEDGTEAVICDRGDGMGSSMLQEKGIDIVVLSTEENPVVTRRCRKLNISCQQGLKNKEKALKSLAREKGIHLSNVVYLGNDLNDMGCLKLAGISVAVADAHPTVLKSVDIVLSKPGGHGAIRELAEMILNKKEE